MPGSELENTKSDTGSNRKRNQRRNSNAQADHFVANRLIHVQILLSHILMNYSTAVRCCQFSAARKCDPEEENF